METWLYFAPYAYEKFLKHGRGAIKIDVSDVEFIIQKGSNWVNIEAKVRYLEIDGDEVLDIANDILDEQLESYDPEKQVCFAFVKRTSPTEIRYHTIVGAPKDQLSPKALYEAKEQKPQ